MKHFFKYLALGLFLAPCFADAKSFSNQFVEFQLPEKWECQLDGTEWVCQSTDEQKKRDAIIVLAAKIKKAGMDELDIYKKHLSQKQVYQSLSGETIESEPRYVKDLDISGHTWVDSLHLQSEIPDFYTRYLATVEADLGILVTFSVRKDKYDEYAPDIENMVRSLRAFRKPGGPNDTPGAGGDTAPPDLFNKGSDTTKTPTSNAGKSGDDMTTIIALVIVVAGAAGFLIWKKKQKK